MEDAYYGFTPGQNPKRKNRLAPPPEYLQSQYREDGTIGPVGLNEYFMPNPGNMMVIPDVMNTPDFVRNQLGYRPNYYPPSGNPMYPPSNQLFGGMNASLDSPYGVNQYKADKALQGAIRQSIPSPMVSQGIQQDEDGMYLDVNGNPMAFRSKIFRSQTAPSSKTKETSTTGTNSATPTSTDQPRSEPTVWEEMNPWEEDYNYDKKAAVYSSLGKNLPKEQKKSEYSPKDWVVGGLEALSLGMGRNAALKAQQEQAFQMQQREQEPMFYSGYYGNRGMTTIGRNQNLIVAEDGALIQSTDTGLENALLERGEHVVYPNGKQMTVGGQKHADRVVNGQQVGGTKTTLPNGTMIFSDKLLVPNTKKTFASVAKKLGGQIEKYMEIANAVGKPRVDVETAELMLQRSIKSLDELFQIQQSINGNHGQDYVDTVGGEEESEEMAVAGNGMIKYDLAGLTGDPPPKDDSKTSKEPTPQSFYELFQNTKKGTAEEQAIFKTLLYNEGISEANAEKVFSDANQTNEFINGVNQYFKTLPEQMQKDALMDRTKGNNFRFGVIKKFVESPMFKYLVDSKKIDPAKLSLFNSGVLETKNGNWRISDKAKDIKSLFTTNSVKNYEQVYKAAYAFTTNPRFANQAKYQYNLKPIGIPDQTFMGAPISPADDWAGNTFFGQGAEPVVKTPEYQAQEKEKQKGLQSSPGQNFEQAKAIRNSKYTSSPFDIRQLIPNVVAASQQIAPYVVPEVPQVRVTPYEQYVDPWVQDAYTMAMAASSMGADPNAMFISAQENVDKIQAQKRSQDAQADYAARMANAQYQRQADMFNQGQLGSVNNQMLNIAKSNKSEADYNALQNALMKQRTYERDVALKNLNWNTISPGFDYDENTGMFTPVKEYNEAMLNYATNPTMLAQEMYTPELIAQAKRLNKPKKKKTETAQSTTEVEQDEE